jgi:hypothetical protein
MRFYLGTHEPTWLSRAHVPLFVSYLRLKTRCKRKLPRARVPWALDSSGFSVLNKHRRYPWSAEVYAADVARFDTEIGNLDWAAIQDWMCEKEVLSLTGLTVEEHQRRTVQSWLDLRRMAPLLPWVPVLQGFTRREYLRCAEMYADAGTDLANLQLVGIGSICRREDTSEAEGIIRELAGKGLKLHGFGFKLGGLERCADVLSSADSMAWSDAARRRSNAAKRAAKRRGKQPGLFDTGGEVSAIERYHSPQNSPRFALDWLDDVEVRAGMKEEPHTMHPCPFCGSNEVHPPMSSELNYCCVDCGESWGDIREPSLCGGLSAAREKKLAEVLAKVA